MNAGEVQSLVAIAVTLLVVLRFARRELYERSVSARSLWIRPALLSLITVYLVSLSLRIDPAGDAEMWLALAGGAILGVIVGVLILANSRFRAADTPSAVRVQGNRITFGIWIAAILVRLAARYLLPHGADPRSQLPLNCGTVALVAVAFVVIAAGFYREIARLSPVAVRRV